LMNMTTQTWKSLVPCATIYGMLEINKFFAITTYLRRT
jgi:hypothetical protein